MTEILAAQSWTTNAHLIADVARLGYLEGRVLDVTHGEGGFWTVWRPEHLTTSDFYAPADESWDYRELPLEACAFDSVVFDPPYKLSGTPTERGDGVARPHSYDSRYGIVGRMSRDDRLEDIRLGTLECYRVARRFLLVKCMDQVEGGIIRWQTDLVTHTVEGAGGRKVDRFDMLRSPRPQPGGRRQLTARRNYSTLLVFEKPARRATGQAAML